MSIKISILRRFQSKYESTRVHFSDLYSIKHQSKAKSLHKGGKTHKRGPRLGWDDMMCSNAEMFPGIEQSTSVITFL